MTTLQRTRLDRVSRRDMTWDAIDAIAGRTGVTVLRSGTSMSAAPDTGLPSDMEGAICRTELRDWKGK